MDSTRYVLVASSITCACSSGGMRAASISSIVSVFWLQLHIYFRNFEIKNMVEVQFNTASSLNAFLRFDYKIEVKIPDEVINEICRNLPNIIDDVEKHDNIQDAIRIARNELNKKQFISALQEELKNRIFLRVSCQDLK